jgi:hypothetical protein
MTGRQTRWRLGVDLGAINRRLTADYFGRFFPRQNVPSLSNRFIFFSNLPRFYTKQKTVDA